MKGQLLPALVILFAASGCSKAPEAVFVDLGTISARQASLFPAQAPALPDRAAKIPASTVTLPHSPGIVLYDKAEGKIAAARKLIEADREQAKKTLARRLAAIQNAKIDDAKRKAMEDLLAEQQKYLDGVYDQLFALFQKYALNRGPKTVRVELLLATRSIFAPSRLKTAPIAAKQAQELADLRKAIQDMDDSYDGEAEKLITDAEYKLSADQGELHAKFETLRANALEAADKQAQQAIDKATGNLDLNLGQNRSVAVDSVSSRSVAVPGSEGKQRPIVFESRQGAVTTEEQQRHQLEQQLDIWLKTRGFIRARSSQEGRDATNEFDAWRKTHRVGP